MSFSSSFQPRSPTSFGDYRRSKWRYDGKKKEEDGGERMSVRVSAAPPPPPTYSLVRRSRGGEARGGRGINCAHSPTSRDYCALTACGNCRWKANGPFSATEDPHLGLGVEVAGLGLQRRPVTRVGWQTLPAKGCHMARMRRAASPQPGMCASWFPPSSFKASPRRLT